MGFGVYREAAAVPITSEEGGYNFAGISAGPGTTALAAGGVVVIPLSAGGGYTADPIDIPTVVKPSDSDSSYMLIGARIPAGGALAIRDRWVTYWEED